MTDSYDNRNSGLLFKSTSDNEKAPAFSGFWTDEDNNQIKIKAYWSKNPDKNGNNFLQISKDTYEREEKSLSNQWRETQAKKEVVTDADEPISLDDIPF